MRAVVTVCAGGKCWTFGLAGILKAGFWDFIKILVAGIWVYGESLVDVGVNFSLQEMLWEESGAGVV